MILYYKVHQNSPLHHSSSVQSLDRLGHWGDMRDDSAEILFQSFLWVADVNSSGMSRISTLWCCPSSISSAYHRRYGMPTLHGALKSLCCGEGVVACGMSEPCKFRTTLMAKTNRQREEEKSEDEIRQLIERGDRVAKNWTEYLP